MLANIDNCWTAERVAGNGRLRTARTTDNVAAVEELVQSQEDKLQKHHTVREAARETGIHRSSVHRVIRKDHACRQWRVCRYSNNDSLKCARNYCVQGSICDFKFPKVVLARISGYFMHSFVKCLFQDMPTNFY